MGLLSRLKREDDIAPQEDRIGGGPRFWQTGLYPVTITSARVLESRGGATGIVFKFKNEEGKELDHTEWVTSGTAKGQLTYYLDQQKNKKYLPGFIVANDICRLSVDKELFELDTEERLVEFYNPETQKVEPQKTPVLVDLIGEEITLGVVAQAENGYKDPSQKVTKNYIDKVFHTSSGLTVVEAEAEAEEAIFIKNWEETYTNEYVKNLFDPKKAEAAASEGGAGEKPKGKSLFPSKG